MIVAAVVIGVAVGMLAAWLTWCYLEQNPPRDRDDG